MIKKIMVTVLALSGLSSDSFATGRFISLIEEQGMKELRKQDRLSLLSEGIKATKKPVQAKIPDDFFLENDPEYKSEKLNDRITVFTRTNERKKEKYNISEKRKDFALLTKDLKGNMLDRRTKIKDIFVFPHLPICYLGIHYEMPNGEIIKFSGTGYRNTLNQIMTAGHNLHLEESDVEYFLRKHDQKKFTFSRENMTLEILFGLDGDHLLPDHIYKVPGNKTFRMMNKDFGIIQLPQYLYKKINDEIGSLPLKNAPNYVYIGKQEISVIGYPGEKNKQMYEHKGTLLKNTIKNELEYDVDTTAGNSGSPIFEWVGADKEKIKVIGTHTHNVDDKRNGGEGIDDEIREFMVAHANFQE